MVAVLAVEQQSDQNTHCQQWSPLQIVGVKAEEDKADIGGNNRPAGAFTGLALVAGWQTSCC